MKTLSSHLNKMINRKIYIVIIYRERNKKKKGKKKENEGMRGRGIVNYLDDVSVFNHFYYNLISLIFYLWLELEAITQCQTLNNRLPMI